MSSSGYPPPGRQRKPAPPCRLYAQGHCHFGDRCKFGHGADVQPARKDKQKDRPHPNPRPDTTPLDREAPGVSNLGPSPSHDTSDIRPRPKPGELSCRAWNAGTCIKGSKCRFRHDVEVQKLEHEPVGSSKQKRAAASHPISSVMEEGIAISPIATANSILHATDSLMDVKRARAVGAKALERVRAREATAAERARAQEAQAVVVRERENAIAREETTKTMNQLVSGSIVTFRAGLDVASLITGFETCTLLVRNLAFDVKEHDFRILLVSQGLDLNQAHFVIKKGSDHKPEARVVTSIAAGQALSESLDGFGFQEEPLVVEMSITNSLEGMNAATSQSADVLTISWHAPSVRYIAEYIDIDTAKAKVNEFNRSVYAGRRLRVELNTQPRGRHVPNLRLNAIKINNLPPDVTDKDVIRLTSSKSVKQLPIGGIFGVTYSTEEIAQQVRGVIELAVPGGLEKFDNPSSTCGLEGVVSARAYFSSWDDAHTAYKSLEDRRFGKQPVWLRLLDPMCFTLTIPVEQYKAQKAQWDSLSSSIKNRKACSLNVRDAGSIVLIRVSGLVKEATGALKVRVENLARGEKIDGWHRSFNITGNPFVRRVNAETGAYMRADGKKKILKLYGIPGAIDQAREMIKAELERLASLDYTITLARQSGNVKFTMASRKITVSGGEEARHALDRLIALSQTGDLGLANVSQGGYTCPVCCDDVSSPHQLGCGHTYCVACLRHFISSALESDQLPLTCLGDEAQCRIPIPIPTIQQFLPSASFNQLFEAAFDTYISKHPAEFKHCKTPDCTQIYRAAPDGAEPQTLHCPSCFSAVCNACQEDAHDGMTCTEARARPRPTEQEGLSDAWIASQGGRVKRCPLCSMPFEKLAGCNHMTCLCGAHICWQCMGVFEKEMIYDHMKNEHGSIYADVPPDLEPSDPGFHVNIDEQLELLRQAEVCRAAGLQNPNGAGPAQYRDHGSTSDAGHVRNSPYLVVKRHEEQEDEESAVTMDNRRRFQEAGLDAYQRLLRLTREAAAREHDERSERAEQREREREERLRQEALTRAQKEHRQRVERERRVGDQRPRQEAERRTQLRAGEWDRRLREHRRQMEQREWRGEEEEECVWCGQCTIM